MRLDTLGNSAAGALAAQLESSGWRRVGQVYDEPGVAGFARQEVEDIAYQLDLLWDVKLDSVNFSIILGVRHVELNTLVSRFMGRASAGRTATFGRSLIDLLPHIVPAELANRWRVRSAAGVESFVETAAGDVEGYGLPFLRNFRNLDDIISHLAAEKRYQMMSGQLAVAYGLASRWAQAEDALHEYANVAESQRGPMLRQSENFLSNFAEHFGFGSDFLPQS
jgi:hypothetical protein